MNDFFLYPCQIKLRKLESESDRLEKTIANFVIPGQNKHRVPSKVKQCLSKKKRCFWIKKGSETTRNGTNGPKNKRTKNT